MSATIGVKELIDQLILRSAMLIDRDELDAWLDCFEEDSRYVVMPRENLELGLPAAVIYCDSKASLKDRVVCLRHANKFNPHYDRHIVGGAWILSSDKGIVSVESNFAVVQTTKTGVSRLFCAGYYRDQIRVSARAAKFVERVVVLDSFAVPTLLATPI
jgi:anthranilate 1,2-dioxygenase small subunit